MLDEGVDGQGDLGIIMMNGISNNLNTTGVNSNNAEVIAIQLNNNANENDEL